MCLDQRRCQALREALFGGAPLAAGPETRLHAAGLPNRLAAFPEPTNGIQPCVQFAPRQSIRRNRSMNLPS
ncbi:MAG: hypothetical protein ACI841_005376 [Planctomycetota bacterium]|jgi:hypothetical protein